MSARDRDPLLERLLAGDLDPDGREAAEAFQRDPELRESWQEAMQTLAILDAAGEHHRELAEEVRQRGSVSGEEHVAAFVLERALGAAAVGDPATGDRSAGAGPPPSAARPRLLRPALWLAAAAALVASLAIALWDGAEPERSGGTFLGSGFSEVAPTGEVDGFSAFAWRYALPAGGWYEVQVFAEDGGEQPLAASGKLYEATWSVDSERAAGWPDRIRWVVTAYDALGGPAASQAFSAERR